MHARFTPNELAARREIEVQIAAASTEEAKDQLRELRQAIADTARGRLKARQVRAARKAEPVPPPAPKSEKRVFTLTSAQKEARANWSNQWTSAAKQKAAAVREVAVVQARAIARTRVYRLFDGTLFFADNGDVISAVPQGCRVFNACDPPHYRQDSRVIEGFFYDELIGHWRPKPQ